MIVYTAITGCKDKQRADIKCFTEYNKFVKPVMNAKIYKILPHKFLDDDITIWLDGNITLLIEPDKLVKEWLKGADMALWKHSDRDCIFDEADAAKGLFIESDKDVIADIDKQMKHYQGFQRHYGLAECNVIIRRNKAIVNQFNEAWWAEICRWSQRDQLSFPVILKQFPKLKVNFIEGNPRNHEYFKYEPH